MMQFLVKKAKLGVQYVREHPHLLLLFALIVVLPILSWLTNQAYLDAAKKTQSKAQIDRVGLVQDLFVSVIRASDFNPEVSQIEIHSLAELNVDIVEFTVAKLVGSEIIPVAALNSDVIDKPQTNPQFYTTALSNPNESFMYPSGDQLYAYRAVIRDNGEIYFVYTKFSLARNQIILETRSTEAFWYFIIMYAFIAVIAFWHFKLTDYRYLYKKAENANKMKDLFTNMIAHELRAPLTAIRGYSSMVEEKTDGEAREYSLRVRESSERLLAIVNDLLDVARIQSGKLSAQIEEMDVSPVIIKVLDELKVSATEKNIQLISEGTNDTHIMLADPKRFHQALTNLVSNSIKYTKEGSITVSVEEKGSEVEMRVKDTGMGISSEDQQKLFAPFFRVESDDVSAITGTGLGMWITKQLIEIMRGSIAVESIKGVGTHIVILFPKVPTKM